MLDERGTISKNSIYLEHFSFLDQFLDQFDPIDLLTYISALQIMPENQSVQFALELASCYILTNLNSANKKHRKFEYKDMIQLGEQMNSGKFMSLFVDPSEKPFLSKVCMLEEYMFFSSIGDLGTYNIQFLLDSVINDFGTDTSFPLPFTQEVGKYFEILLQLSNTLVMSLLHTESSETIEVNYDINNQLNIPAKKRLYKYISIVQLTPQFEVIIKEHLPHLILETDCLPVNYSLAEDPITLLLNSPFLRLPNKRYLILSPKLLPIVATHYSLRLAQKERILSKVVDKWNLYMKKDIYLSLEQLGHNHVVPPFGKDELLSTREYEEGILNIGNRKVMISIILLDKGNQYASIYGHRETTRLAEQVFTRTTELYQKISESVDDKDIFVVIIDQGIGRTLVFPQLSNFFQKSEYKYLSLNGEQLKAISYTERTKKFFLPRYMITKKQIYSAMTTFGDFDLIALYSESDESFYINDSAPIRDGVLYAEIGFAREYLEKYYYQLDTRVVNGISDEYRIVIERYNNRTQIYSPASVNTPSGKMKQYLRINNNLGIWFAIDILKDSGSIDAKIAILDATTYWFNELSTVLNETLNIAGTFKVLFSLPKDTEISLEIQDKLLERKESLFFLETKGDDTLKVNLSSKFLHYFSCDSNEREREFIEMILKSLFPKYYDSIISCLHYNIVFSPPEKKMVKTYEIATNPILRPLNYKKTLRQVSTSDENRLLDYIGYSLLHNYEMEIGIVNEEKQNETTNLIVSILYKLLQKHVEDFSKEYWIENLIYDLEQNLHHKVRFQKSFIVEQARFGPEEVAKQINRIDKSVHGLRFLLEYISATKLEGIWVFDELEYEYAITMCYSIIEWAFTNDMLRYQHVTTPIEILPSERVSLEQQEFIHYSKRLQHAVLGTLGKKTIDFDIKDITLKFSLAPYRDKLDDAFRHANGYTLTQKLSTMTSILLLGDLMKEDVKKIEYGGLINILLSILLHLCLHNKQRLLFTTSSLRKEMIF